MIKCCWLGLHDWEVVEAKKVYQMKIEILDKHWSPEMQGYRDHCLNSRSTLAPSGIPDETKDEVEKLLFLIFPQHIYYRDSRELRELEGIEYDSVCLECGKQRLEIEKAEATLEEHFRRISQECDAEKRRKMEKERQERAKEEEANQKAMARQKKAQHWIKHGRIPGGLSIEETRGGELSFNSNTGGKLSINEEKGDKS